MAIVKMKKLRFMTVSSQASDLLRELQLLGCVEITEPRTMEEDELPGGLSRCAGADAARLRADHAALISGIKLLDKYAPVKTKILAPLPEAKLSELLDEKNLPAGIRLAEKLIGLDDRIRRLSAQESRERALVESLQPWRDLDMPLDCSGTRTSAAILAVFPASAEMEKIRLALRDATENAELFLVSSDKDLHYTVLVCLRTDMEEAVAGLRPLGYSAISLGDVAGTARENIAAAETRLDEINREKADCAAEIIGEAPGRAALKLRADTLSIMIAKAEAEAKRLCTESVSCFEGWVPEEREAELAEALGKYDCAWETADPDPEEYPEVPVKLKNNRFTRPLNMVTEMYSLPAYDGVDPNPLMAPFFILFYGLMMADMGYGILMIIAGLLVLKKKKPKGGMRTFFELMLVCGIAVLLSGLATGGFFGNSIVAFSEAFLGITAGDMPVWLQKFNDGLLFNPLDDTVFVLFGSMALGFIQIITGMIVGFVQSTKEGKFWDAVMDQGSWWLVFAGLAIGAVTGFWWVAIAGFAALVCTQGRSKPTLIGKVVGGVASLYDITGYFGDVLSYTRIMALMLAGTVIAQVFNTLGAMTGNIAFFFIIFLIGNMLNFGLNLLGCYVHDLRLQCLEYFGKFYKDGGRPFKPVGINTTFYNITE